MYFDSDQVAQALDETARHEDRERGLLGFAVAFVLGWLVGGRLRWHRQG